MTTDALTTIFSELKAGVCKPESYLTLTEYLDAVTSYQLLRRGKSQNITGDDKNDIVSNVLTSLLCTFLRKDEAVIPDEPKGYLKSVVFNEISEYFLSFNQKDYHKVYVHVKDVIKSLENQGILVSSIKDRSSSELRYGASGAVAAQSELLSYHEILSCILENEPDIRNESGRWTASRKEEIARVITLMVSKHPDRQFILSDAVKGFAHAMGIFELEVEDVIRVYGEDDSAEEVLQSDALNPEEETTYRIIMADAAQKIEAYLSALPQKDIGIIQETFLQPGYTLAQIADIGGMKRTSNADYFIRKHSEFFSGLSLPIRQLGIDADTRRRMIIRMTDDIYTLIASRSSQSAPSGDTNL